MRFYKVLTEDKELVKVYKDNDIIVEISEEEYIEMIEVLVGKKLKFEE